jgi:uncharacterized protein YrrD
MNIRKNADVITSRGRKIGRVGRVVLDPQTREVTHIVVKKGQLLTRDKFISIDQIDSATKDHILLRKSTVNPDEFPDFL